jgi:hypothetical protein
MFVYIKTHKPNLFFRRKCYVYFFQIYCVVFITEMYPLQFSEK